MIELQHVSAGYGSKLVVEDISLALHPGQVLTLLGPNGSGKSTLLRTIAGLHPMAGGQITVDGVPVKELTRRQMAQKITYMPQSRTIPNITARKMVLHGRFPYLSYPRRYRKEDYEAARRAMERSDAWELADSPVQSLSGGQRQKVYLAMAMAQETQTILMDEPSTALDPVNRRAVINTINTLPQTKLIASHDLDMILDTCQRVILLARGKIVADGPADHILRDQALLEANRMELPFCLQGRR